MIKHQLIEERCIACGHCFIACPQNARKVHSDIENIKDAIGKGQKVIATLAPSFVASFPIKEGGGQVVSALKKIRLLPCRRNCHWEQILFLNYIERSLVVDNIKYYYNCMFFFQYFSWKILSWVARLHASCSNSHDCPWQSIKTEIWNG